MLTISHLTDVCENYFEKIYFKDNVISKNIFVSETF